MGLIILPGQNDRMPEREPKDEVYWLHPYKYKGFFIQGGRYQGRYKIFAKSINPEVDRRGKLIQPEFESDWKDYLTEARQQIEIYINAYRGN